MALNKTDRSVSMSVRGAPGRILRPGRAGSKPRDDVVFRPRLVIYPGRRTDIRPGRSDLMNMKSFLAFIVFLILLGAFPRGARAQESADGMRFIPDVHAQFAALTEEAEPLGFHIDGSPN